MEWNVLCTLSLSRGLLLLLQRGQIDDIHIPKYFVRVAKRCRESNPEMTIIASTLQFFRVL